LREPERRRAPGERRNKRRLISISANRFYVTGGTLRPDTSSYVERQADCDLYDGLTASERRAFVIVALVGSSHRPPPHRGRRRHRPRPHRHRPEPLPRVVVRRPPRTLGSA